jgi:hypothetical protein
MDRKQIRALIGAALMGAAGASLGATVGKGVGETLPEMLLALFVFLFMASFSIETIILRSWEHLLIFISGGIAGLIIESFVDSSILIYLVGAIVGVGVLPVLERLRSLLEEFTRRTPWFWPALFVVIVGSILLPILDWAFANGVLFDVILAITFFSLPLVAFYLVRRFR